MQIAVVADVHLHDLYGGYGIVEQGSGEVALRTLADTMSSTRVFNESHAAFLAVLDDIVQRGICDVVLLGDYSDDGQIDAVVAVKRILSSYEYRHGLRFFTTFGNHDSYGDGPRHVAKRLTKTDGLEPRLVSSDTAAAAQAIVCPGMRGMSTAEAIEAMAPYGVARPASALHWETPSGRAHLDASYLVEPQEGLWLLMLDANVFQKVGDSWDVRADAAWDHVLSERPYVMEWIADVVDRATRMGKTLLAFSHYPVLPLALTGKGANVHAACTPDWAQRMPSLETGRRLAKAGLQWHFSGHMHVAARTEMNGLSNLAVPSPVAYPGGYVIVEIDNGTVKPEMVLLKETPGFDVAFAAYENQTVEEDKLKLSSVLSHSTYADFLHMHLLHLVATKHAPNDWQPELHSYLEGSIADLLREDGMLSPLVEKWQIVVSQPFRTMMDDYYILRAGHERALQDIPPSRRDFYYDLRHTLDALGQEHTASVTGVFLKLFFACSAWTSGSVNERAATKRDPDYRRRKRDANG